MDLGAVTALRAGTLDLAADLAPTAACSARPRLAQLVMGTVAAGLEVIPNSSKAAYISLGHCVALCFCTGGMDYPLILGTWSSTPRATEKMPTSEADLDLRSPWASFAAGVLSRGPCAQWGWAKQRPAMDAAAASIT